MKIYEFFSKGCILDYLNLDYTAHFTKHMIVPLLSYLQITVQIFYLFMFRLLFHKILMGLFSMKGWSGEEVKIEVTDIGKGDSPAGSHNIHISSKSSYDAGCLPNFRNRIPTHFLDFSCLVSNFS